jgi:hypothetical protein
MLLASSEEQLRLDTQYATSTQQAKPPNLEPGPHAPG